jgi:hypothetical protein
MQKRVAMQDMQNQQQAGALLRQFLGSPDAVQATRAHGMAPVDASNVSKATAGRLTGEGNQAQAAADTIRAKQPFVAPQAQAELANLGAHTNVLNSSADLTDAQIMQIGALLGQNREASQYFALHGMGPTQETAQLETTRRGQDLGVQESTARNKSGETTAAMGVLPYVQQQIPRPGPIGPKGERTTIMGPNPLFEQILQRGGFAPSAPAATGSGIPPEAAQAVMQLLQKTKPAPQPSSARESMPPPRSPYPSPPPEKPFYGPTNTTTPDSSFFKGVGDMLKRSGSGTGPSVPGAAPVGPANTEGTMDPNTGIHFPQSSVPQMQKYLSPETQQNPEMITRLIQALMQQYMA